MTIAALGWIVVIPVTETVPLPPEFPVLYVPIAVKGEPPQVATLYHAIIAPALAVAFPVKV
jgi:hypothetical protein